MRSRSRTPTPITSSGWTTPGCSRAWIGGPVPVYCERETEECIRRVFHYAFHEGTDRMPAGFVPKLHFIRVRAGRAVRGAGRARAADPAGARAVPGAGVPGRRRWRTAPTSAGSPRRAGRCWRGSTCWCSTPCGTSRTRRISRSSEALAVVGVAQAAADLLDAPVAQLRSWTDAGHPAGERHAGLRRVERGVLRDASGRSSPEPSRPTDCMESKA